MLEDLDEEEKLHEAFYKNNTMRYQTDKRRMLESFASDRRHLAASSITNPILCIVEGQAIQFPVDTASRVYPVYQQNSLLNSNLGFDYGQFLQLGTAVNGGQTITSFMFTFYEKGIYVIADSQDAYKTMIVTVLASSETCPADLQVSAKTLRALYSLNLMDGSSTDEVSLGFFWRLVFMIIVLSGGLVGLITYLQGTNKKWGLFDCCKRKNTKVQQKEDKEKEELSSILNAQELRNIREELRKHIDALKFRLAEMAEAKR